jgi:hypothetical protein
MKSMSWPMAAIVIASVLVVGGLALFDKDVNAALNAIIFLLMALGYAELREIKSNTNGSNAKLIEELAEYRRNQARITDKALESQPLVSSEPK